MNSSPEQRLLRIRLIAIGASFAVGALLMALKFYIFRMTGSSAILSDALESIINVVASAFALGSILLAAKPPDETHPYGHGKIEYFSAGFEGALIVLAAFGIFKAGWSRMLYPRGLTQVQDGLLLLLLAALVNLVLGMALVTTGRKTRSLILVADGKHVLTDVYTTAGVLAGLLVAELSGWHRLDGAIACLVGVNILHTGAKLVRQSFSGLMNAAEPELLREIAGLIQSRRKDIWIDIHQLRAWRAGNLLHMDFHMILPRDLTLDEAHREAKELEGALMEHFGGNASVLIHLDPCEDPDCPVCRMIQCRLRSRQQEQDEAWNRDRITRQTTERGD